MDKKKQAGPQKQQFDTSTLLLIARPIATNSRVKKTQKLHRDMHLAFVNNALERKSQVRIFLLRLCWRQLTSDHRETLKILTSWSVSSISRVCLTTHPHRDLSFGCGSPHSPMSSPAWSGHTLPFPRPSSRCPGQPWTVNSSSHTPHLSACLSVHDQNISPSCLKRSSRDLHTVRVTAQRFRLDPSTDFLKILESIPLTLLCQNLHLHPLQDA
jgi:hypothetical protein